MYYGCILAGGRSSRMGQDKSALELKGKSLLELAQQLLHNAGATQVLISGRPDLPDGIPDLLPHCGPPGGVYACLHHIKTHQVLDGSAIVFIPVDMPLLQVASIELLLEASRHHSACHFEAEVFPCVLPASEELYLHLQALFADDTKLGGSRSMKGLMKFLHATALPSSERGAEEFLNANTPADWQLISDLSASDN